MPPAEASALPPDTELVQRLSAGEEAAFALILTAWSAGMLRLARSFVSTADSADEVVQDTWLAIITSIRSFEGRSSLKTWAYRILVNTAKRRGERESRTVPWSSWATTERDEPAVDPARFQADSEPYPGHWREFPPAWPSPESEVLAGEIRGQVAAAVEDLPARQQVVITLRDVEGYTSEEVCEILDISAVNQRVLLHRARAAVRSRLEQYFASGSQSPTANAEGVPS